MTGPQQSPQGFLEDYELRHTDFLSDPLKTLVRLH